MDYQRFKKLLIPLIFLFISLNQTVFAAHLQKDKPIVANKSLTEYLTEAMKAYHVPVAGYAVIDDGKIVKAETLSIRPQLKVNQQSIFQAASISKILSTMAALKLVEEGKLKLDEPANDFLKHWKISENQYTHDNPVLVKQLLDMTSGLSISNFDGYKQNEKLPILIQLLKGEKPANNMPVEVLYKPGSRYQYSNGGFETLQAIIENLTDKPFAKFENQKVLAKLNMPSSIFEFPLSKQHAKHAVPGFVGDNEISPGGWHNYSGLAACGMWSTPMDIAHLLLNITNSYRGKTGFLSEKLTNMMLTRQVNTPFGFGVVVNGQGNEMNFAKTGHTLGYQSLAIMFPNTGKGVVIMTNAESGEYVINYFVSVVAKTYNWPYYFPFFDESVFLPNY